jgi:hypothetical protein
LKRFWAQSHSKSGTIQLKDPKAVMFPRQGIILPARFFPVLFLPLPADPGSIETQRLSVQ